MSTELLVINEKRGTVKQLVILSGKGGTGKTSVAAAFAHLASAKHRAVLADADVDAANLELVLNPTVLETHDFIGGQIAILDEELCDGCGICIEVCRFDAIADTLPDPPIIDPIACDGCAACVYQCPSEAIQMKEQLAGHWFRSESRYGPLFHAALRAAQENSGKLVTTVRRQARLLAIEGEYDFIIIDGPPGIGCPVISAATGADLALIVTEPTAAGVHDMERVLQTTSHFGVPSLVCINKADLHPEGAAAIEAYCEEKGIEVIGRIPFDTSVTKAMVQGVPVTAYENTLVTERLQEIWERVLAKLVD